MWKWFLQSYDTEYVTRQNYSGFWVLKIQSSISISVFRSSAWGCGRAVLSTGHWLFLNWSFCCRRLLVPLTLSFVRPLFSVCLSSSLELFWSYHSNEKLMGKIMYCSWSCDLGVLVGILRLHRPLLFSERHHVFYVSERFLWVTEEKILNLSLVSYLKN